VNNVPVRFSFDIIPGVSVFADEYDNGDEDDHEDDDTHGNEDLDQQI